MIKPLDIIYPSFIQLATGLRFRISQLKNLPTLILIFLKENFQPRDTDESILSCEMACLGMVYGKCVVFYVIDKAMMFTHIRRLYMPLYGPTSR